MQKISTEFTFALELLQALIRDQRQQSYTLIICSSREDFFSQLLHQIKTPLHQGADAHAHEEYSTPALHPLLAPTLRLLAVSSSIKLVYCASLPVLRARLSTHISEPQHSAKQQLLILDLIALHHGTSEFTLQGLSRTLAAAVSAANQTGSDLNLVECKNITDPTNPSGGPGLWHTHVPLLSGSVKIGQEGSRWAGQSITIEKIASRWFKFESAEKTKYAEEFEDRNDVEDMLI